MLYSRIQGAKAEKLVKELHSYEQPLCFPIFVTDEAAHAEASDALDRARYERDRDSDEQSMPTHKTGMLSAT